MVGDSGRELGRRCLKRVSLYFVGGTFLALIVFVAVMSWYVPEPSDFQRQVARWIVALTSALLCTFLFGGIVLEGWMHGWKVSASGGVALFLVLVWLVNPFATPETPKEQPTWKGASRLGSLLRILADAYAEGLIKERIVIDVQVRDQIEHFWVESSEWTGRTWGELVNKICWAYPCLACRRLGYGAIEVSLDGKVESAAWTMGVGSICTVASRD